jgi:hypothetical protein
MDEGIPERSVTQGKVKGPAPSSPPNWLMYLPTYRATTYILFELASSSLILFYFLIQICFFLNQLWFQFHTWISRIENPNSKSHLVR